MELRILLFLIFACGTILMNTALIFLAYKAFSGLSIKVTATVSELEKTAELKQFIGSLHAASKQAVTVTQATKERIAELEPVISKVHETYNRSIAQVDSKLEKVAGQMNTSAEKVRDTVAKPAFSVMAFAAGLTKFLQTMKGDE
jgi:predicted ATPase with chaperone activity